MAMAPSIDRLAPPASSGNVPALTEAQRNVLRQVRAEAQDLRTILEDVRKGETTFKANVEYIRKTAGDLQELMVQVPDGEDTVRHLCNVYEQMIQNPLFAHPEKELAAQDQLHALSMLEAQIREIEYYVGMLTIPKRVNQWLKNERPGYYIPFHAVFEAAEDRSKILSYLVWSSNTIEGGIVDPANGLIYRYSDSPWMRLLDLGLVLAALLVGSGLVVGACYLRVPGWPIQPAQLSAFVVGWLALLVGVIAHVGVGTVKRGQTQGGLPPITSLGDLPLMLDARSGEIVLKILLALIGFFGLAFASGIENVTALNAFLVGYSLDSFVEIFGTGIEKRAAAQAEALKKQFGVD